MRSGAGDIAGGNFIDLLRQRKGGLQIKAIMGFQTFSNLVTVRSDSPIQTFNDLMHKRIGQFGTATLDWLIIRTAGKTAYGIDLGKDAEPVTAAPVLFNQLLEKKQIDAALQFSTLTLAPLASGQQRTVMATAYLLKQAGYTPRNLLYLQWMLTEDWMKKYPGAVTRLQQAIAETYKRLKTDDSLWPPLAKLVFITDPQLVNTYMKKNRLFQNPPLLPKQIPATQKLLNDILATVGIQNVGIKKIDPNAFVFPPATTKK
jgi:ABC-type nitrate/sulfonate/bicarbonate transport system substrate-binding protein